MVFYEPLEGLISTPFCKRITTNNLDKTHLRNIRAKKYSARQPRRLCRSEASVVKNLAPAPLTVIHLRAQILRRNGATLVPLIQQPPALPPQPPEAGIRTELKNLSCRNAPLWNITPHTTSLPSSSNAVSSLPYPPTHIRLTCSPMRPCQKHEHQNAGYGEHPSS